MSSSYQDQSAARETICPTDLWSSDNQLTREEEFASYEQDFHNQYQFHPWLVDWIYNLDSFRRTFYGALSINFTNRPCCGVNQRFFNPYFSSLTNVISNLSIRDGITFFISIKQIQRPLQVCASWPKVRNDLFISSRWLSSVSSGSHRSGRKLSGSGNTSGSRCNTHGLMPTSVPSARWNPHKSAP